MTIISSITPSRLSEILKEQSIDIIDVRTPAEFREAHLAQARNIPIDTLDPKKLSIDENSSTKAPLYFICKAGNRGATACKMMRDSGFSKVWNIEGGTEACIAAGLPVVRGKKVISIERQVRIMAGAIVLIGALLAILVHPYFALIPIFIGGGLMFAGITDSCGMALLLGKMPWNR